MLAKSVDAEGNMFVERNAQFFSALDNVFATDTLGEGFVFHAPFHEADFQVENALGRPDVGAGDEETGQFIAGEERVFEWSLAGNAGIIGVGKNGPNHFFRIMMSAENFCPFGGVLAVGGMVVVGPPLVIKVMKERGDAPEVLVGAVFPGIGLDTSLDSEHVLAETLGLRVFAE